MTAPPPRSRDGPSGNLEGMTERQGPVRRRLVLATCCLSIFIVSLDNTIVNVALPSIRRDLDASVSELQWTIDAYTLVARGLVMVAGLTARRGGGGKNFRLGLTLFSLGSLL